MLKHLYLFSGLGADERVFQKLDLTGYSTTFIKWIVPNRQESIKAYATRLLDQIKTPKPILVGLSFGGMVAIEMAKQIETQKVILISSAKTKSDIPFYFRTIGNLGLHNLIPTALLKQSNLISNWFFGISSTFEKNLLKKILKDTNPVFLKWAIDKIVNWKNEQLINNTFHIHGTNDKLLPDHFITCNYRITNGGHFMILNKADEISKVFRKQVHFEI